MVVGGKEREQEDTNGSWLMKCAATHSPFSLVFFFKKKGKKRKLALCACHLFKLVRKNVAQMVESNYPLPCCFSLSATGILPLDQLDYCKQKILCL